MQENSNPTVAEIAVATGDTARSAIIVTVLSIVAAGVSLCAQLSITATFGASLNTDAYFLASTYPILVINLIGSAGTTVLIPMFLDTLTKRGCVCAWRLAATIIVILMAVALSAVGIGLAVSRRVLSLAAPGMSAEYLDLTTGLFHLYVPVTIVLCCNNLLIGIHNALSRFVLPTFTTILPQLGMMIGVLLLSPEFGIRSLLLGQLAGALSQTLLLAHGIVGPERLWFAAAFRDPGIKTSFVMMAPLFAGGVVYQFIPFVERYFAAPLYSGCITHLSVAARIATLLSFLTAGLAPTLFTRLSTQAAQGNNSGAYATLSLTVRVFALICTPLVVMAPLYARPLVAMVFQRGHFGSFDTDRVATFLPYYFLAMAAAGVGTLIAKGYYSLLHDTLTVSTAIIVHFGLYAVSCALLAPVLGGVGLAIAVAVHWCSLILTISILLRKRLGGKGGSAILTTGFRCLIAAGMAFLVALGGLHFIPRSPFADFGVIALAFFLYALFAWRVLRVSEIDILVERMRGVFGRPGEVSAPK